MSEGTSPTEEPVVRLSQEEMHKLRFPQPAEGTIHSSYSPHMPGKDIQVFVGSGKLVQGDTSLNVKIKSAVQFFPSPQLRAVVTGNIDPGCTNFMPNQDANSSTRLVIPSSEETYDVAYGGTNWTFRGRPKVKYRANLIVRQQDYPASNARFTSVVFHLLNFPDFWWKTDICRGCLAPIVATFGGWVLTIEDAGISGDVRRQSERDQTYTITHLAEIHRLDGAQFGPADWASVDEFLYYTLGFLAGKGSGPALAQGRNETQQIVWRDQLIPSLGHDRHHSHWFPRSYPTHIHELIQGAWKRWQAEDEREALQRSIEWYWQCVDRETIIENRLILSQVDLELLSWVIMVEEGGRLSGEGFRKLPASDRIALLANQLGASAAIPPPFESLLAEAASQHWNSAPQALAEIRNKIIHPEKRGRGIVVSLNWKARLQAAEWGVWLVELGILWLLGYRGRYDSRTAKPGQPFPMVPWIDPTQAGATGADVA
jgi:hypothetical protein